MFSVPQKVDKSIQCVNENTPIIRKKTIPMKPSIIHRQKIQATQPLPKESDILDIHPSDMDIIFLRCIILGFIGIVFFLIIGVFSFTHWIDLSTFCGTENILSISAPVIMVMVEEFLTLYLRLGFTVFVLIFFVVFGEEILRVSPNRSVGKEGSSCGVDTVSQIVV